MDVTSRRFPVIQRYIQFGKLDVEKTRIIPEQRLLCQQIVDRAAYIYPSCLIPQVLGLVEQLISLVRLEVAKDLILCRLLFQRLRFFEQALDFLVLHLFRRQAPLRCCLSDHIRKHHIVFCAPLLPKQAICTIPRLVVLLAVHIILGAKPQDIWIFRIAFDHPINRSAVQLRQFTGIDHAVQLIYIVVVKLLLLTETKSFKTGADLLLDLQQRLLCCYGLHRSHIIAFQRDSHQRQFVLCPLALGNAENL